MKFLRKTLLLGLSNFIAIIIFYTYHLIFFVEKIDFKNILETSYFGIFILIFCFILCAIFGAPILLICDIFFKKNRFKYVYGGILGGLFIDFSIFSKSLLYKDKFSFKNLYYEFLSFIDVGLFFLLIGFLTGLIFTYLIEKKSEIIQQDILVDEPSKPPTQ